MSLLSRMLAVGVAALVAALPAAAADQTVTITKAGFVPAAVTIGVGERVTFTNADTTVHQLVFNRTTGISCTPSNMVAQPTQRVVCTFSTPTRTGSTTRSGRTSRAR